MGKFTEFKLPLKSLAAGVHEFEYHLDKQFFANMDSADIRDAELVVRLLVTYAHDVYELSFAVTGAVTLLCDRCLDDLVFPIEASYHVTVKYGEDYSDDSDELLQIPESDNFLNVAYMIYDTVSLAIPLKHVHPSGKCNKQMSALLRKHRVEEAGAEDIPDIDDLADDCADGSDAAVSVGTDPRWDALKKFPGSGQ